MAHKVASLSVLLLRVLNRGFCFGICSKKKNPINTVINEESLRLHSDVNPGWKARISVDPSVLNTLGHYSACITATCSTHLLPPQRSHANTLSTPLLSQNSTLFSNHINENTETRLGCCLGMFASYFMLWLVSTSQGSQVNTKAYGRGGVCVFNVCVQMQYTVECSAHQLGPANQQFFHFRSAQNGTVCHCISCFGLCSAAECLGWTAIAVSHM